MWVTCGLGPYNFDFMTEVKREIMSSYHVDGIFINRWDGSGQCYCEHCRTNFKTATGHELPRSNNPQDPARRAYILWRQDRLFALWRHWDDAVRAINSEVRERWIEHFWRVAMHYQIDSQHFKEVAEMADHIVGITHIAVARVLDGRVTDLNAEAARVARYDFAIVRAEFQRMRAGSEAK